MAGARKEGRMGNFAGVNSWKSTVGNFLGNLYIETGATLAGENNGFSDVTFTWFWAEIIPDCKQKAAKT